MRGKNPFWIALGMIHPEMQVIQPLNIGSSQLLLKSPLTRGSLT